MRVLDDLDIRSPTTISLDSAENMLVCSPGNRKLVVVPALTRNAPTALSKGGFESPIAAVIDKRPGHIFVAERSGQVQSLEFRVFKLLSLNLLVIDLWCRVASLLALCGNTMTQKAVLESTASLLGKVGFAALVSIQA